MSRAKPPKWHGVALVDKPKDCTSHDVVQQLRRGLGQRQVGHTGTLDPSATGLLVLTLGRATRIGQFLETTNKIYEGTVQLGTATTTWDAEGEAVETALVPPLLDHAVRLVIDGLQGEFEQTVPVYSAVKVDGERLHRKARRGELVEGPKRMVTIHSLSILDMGETSVDIRAEVSKGTYIRSLAVEIGRRLGLPAHLSKLRRISVGSHSVFAAHSVDTICQNPGLLVPASAALSHLPALTLGKQEIIDVAYGRRPPQLRITAKQMRFVDPRGSLVAVAHRLQDRPDQFQYDVVLIRPEDLEGTV
ncbi:MAG: tRNA pseudouridine(55) synthase TruB [Myxococcales bacterium]|nr:tRNA pseudouridine(55) synthase TruB [Myxococcales bacterium]